MPQDTPSRELDKVIVRLPDGMRDQLKAAAESNRRSMNAEIVARLAESLQMGAATESLAGHVEDIRQSRGKVEARVDQLLILTEKFAVDAERERERAERLQQRLDALAKAGGATR